MTKPTNVQMPFPMMPIVEEQDGTKIVESDFHTLFVSDEDPVFEEIVAINNETDEPITALNKVKPNHKKYSLYVDEFRGHCGTVHKIYNELRKGDKHDDLFVYFNSPGGYIDESLVMYNIMAEYFSGRTTTVIDGGASSAAANLFCMGDTRIGYETSHLMFHNYSVTVGGKGGEITKAIEFQNKLTKDFFNRYILSKGFITDEEFRDMLIGDEIYLDITQMAKRGIVTHVKVGDYTLDKDAYLRYLDSDENDITVWATNEITEATEAIQAEEEAIEKELEAEEKRIQKLIKLGEKALKEQEARKVSTKPKTTKKTTKTKPKK